MIRVSRMTSAKLSPPSHSLLKRTSVCSGTRIWRACSTYVSAFASISSSERIGRSRRAARRIADPGRVVADDEDADVPFVLEGAHALERDAASDVDVGRGDVDAELDAERSAERELRLERTGGQNVHGVPRELGDAHVARPA